MLIQTLVKQNYVARERVEKQKHEVFTPSLIGCLIVMPKTFHHNE